MSDYLTIKVLRIPIDFINLESLKTEAAKHLSNYDMEDFPDSLNDGIWDLFDYGTVGKFQITFCDRYSYLDYILYREYDGENDYGRIRELYESEKKKYLPIFQSVCPDIDMNKVKLVQYCWYNCSEPPDYYEKDDFYDEV